MTTLIVVIPAVLMLAPETEAKANPWDNVPTRNSSTDHRDMFDGPFEAGRDVTLACLSCHEDAAFEVMQTNHWTWQAEPVEVAWRDEPVSVGKANLLNNFCIGIQSNWTGCTRCHAGYGWEDADFFETADESQVDCLVCHDQTGTYAKAAAGLVAEGVNLLAVAESVGVPNRETCGGCHFDGGGGNAVKHGDLDSSLYNPGDHVDVHMGRYDFVCIDCHQTETHLISGRAISVSVDDANQIYCTDCHDDETHNDERINSHLAAIACQTCHVPAGATREPTKMQWDWSTAGQDDIPEDEHEYLKIKGTFKYEEDFMPEYAWYNGVVESRYLLGDVIDPLQITVLNMPDGDITDPDARIFPFKIHRATQIYDTGYNYLLLPKTVGEGGFWTDFDWDQAARLGAEAVGMEYSGEYGFVATEMYWPQTHLVMPAEHALQCTDCHSANGRMDWEALGYYGDPMHWGGRTGQMAMGE
ncbi:MAG: tetrathionate reductase family octaheme c-type cytochrome [Anaerolineae bacterium]|nr:tetrathionate reductase family octaheme c-type cytochrome [Anaerolineae bacterium]